MLNEPPRPQHESIIIHL